MKQYLSAFISGLIFAIGLGISGMMNPEKIQGFLNITGQWDPSLALVMGGALLVTSFSFPFIFRMRKPVYEGHFSLPVNKTIDKKLVVGGVLFGVGWAIGGLCPGPAVANIAALSQSVITFVLSMGLGWWIYQKVSILDIKSHALTLEEEKRELTAFRIEQCVVD